jgi:hypothetical protein
MKRKPEKTSSPCDDCPRRETFSFWGCMKRCDKFMSHLAEVAKGKESPCKDFRCGVPEADNSNREMCEKCPIRPAYASRFGKFSKRDVRCVLGIKDRNVYLAPWEIRDDFCYRR